MSDSKKKTNKRLHTAKYTANWPKVLAAKKRHVIREAKRAGYPETKLRKHLSLIRIRLGKGEPKVRGHHAG